MKEFDKIPVTKVQRATKFVVTGAKIGKNYLKHYGKQLIHGDDDRSTLHEDNARDIYKSLSELKGSALKVAQMLSMDKSLLPTAYQRQFAMAQYSAPPLSYPLVVKTFQKYFGKGPEQLFDTFTKSAVNAASMGQVHQATRNGKKLAVKIQYPGVADSVKSDLAMVKPIALSMFKLNPVEYFRADRTEAAVRGKRIEAELQYLKAQVNPHFLFNAINSVYFLIKKDPEKASETLIKLSDLLRFQLYDCSSDTIGIDQELVYLENYMALEKLRRGERVTVEYRREGELRGFQLAPLMLIPFLENAFKFVSSHTDRPNIIRVVLSREGEMFRASFFNTYEKLQRNGVGGIGLKNVTRRLELLYPKYTLDVRDEHDTYSVTLTIPLL